MNVEIVRVGPESAAEVLAIVRAAFSARVPLDPPADALAETEETMAAHLAAYGGLMARRAGRPVGALVMDPAGSTLFLRRFSVVPTEQGHGVAHAMVEQAVALGEDLFEDLAVLARVELPRNVRFWERMGFREVARAEPVVELRRPLRTHVIETATPDRTREWGARLATVLRAGDLLVLSGGLGAGKTTFTRGIGEGLGVRGGVTSPTFVLARVHPSLVGGPALVHVDAYRLGSLAELDDLDLETDLDDAVTVVEWGEGLVEGLAESRLEIRIVRTTGGDSDDIGASSDASAEEALDPRRIEVTPVGPRWHGLDWHGLDEHSLDGQAQREDAEEAGENVR